MLPAEHRLRHRAEFSAVLGSGRRAGRPLLTAHLSVPAVSSPPASLPTPAARAGLVVSKAVGNAVVRHRTSRRLRHLLAARLGSLPAGARLVVRAAPAAGSASSEALGRDLDAALARVLAPRPPGPR